MKGKTNWEFTVALVAAVIAAILIASPVLPGEPALKLKLAIGYGLLILVFMFGLAVLIEIVRGRIDISELLEEVDGGASMSRFQLLIFTFVIALSLFLMVAAQEKFPAVPPEVLTLLGISASTYAVSKGIQMSNPSQAAGLTLTPTTLGPPAAGAALPATSFTASLVNTPAGTPMPALTWSLDAPAHGTLTPQSSNTALYTPATGIASGTKVTIRAQAAGYEDGTAVVTY